MSPVMVNARPAAKHPRARSEPFVDRQADIADDAADAAEIRTVVTPARRCRSRCAPP